MIKILASIESKYGLMIKYSEENIALIKKVKSYLFEYCMVNNEYESKKREIKEVFG